MEIIVFFSILIIFYLMIAFFDYFFKSCMHLPYKNLLKFSGLDIKLFRISWQTTYFNRLIGRISRRFPNFNKTSYLLGVYFTILLFPIAIFLLVSSLFPTASQQTNNVSSGENEGVGKMEILLPGVNLPLQHIGYYITALLICSVLHEAGHGIAAYLEDVTVLGFGLHLMLIIPIASTEIDTLQMRHLNVWKKLKIFSAGIWHNFLLAAFSYGLLLLLPVLLSPLYSTDNAVFITNIQKNSPVRGEKGLYIGDSITLINGCRVKSENDFEECLRKSIENHPAYCVSEDFVRENEESDQEIRHDQNGLISCCPEGEAAVNCFENLSDDSDDHHLQYFCLNIRRTVEHSKDYCQATKECPQQTFCIKSLISNSSTILHIKRKNRQIDFVYFGHPIDVLRSIEISKFVPKTKVINPWLGDAIVMLLKYIIVFSSGLVS
jgi:S2P endopeptidase